MSKQPTNYLAKLRCSNCGTRFERVTAYGVPLVEIRFKFGETGEIHSSVHVSNSKGELVRCPECGLTDGVRKLK